MRVVVVSQDQQLIKAVNTCLASDIPCRAKSFDEFIRLHRCDRGAEIKAWQEKDEAIIAVTDSGTGIDRQFLPRVFERFSQQDGSAARRYGGLGLGLAIVRHIVELHGGSVNAESEGLGKGSTFRIRLPLPPALSRSA